MKGVDALLNRACATAVLYVLLLIIQGQTRRKCRRDDAIREKSIVARTWNWSFLYMLVLAQVLLQCYYGDEGTAYGTRTQRIKRVQEVSCVSERTSCS
jgi:hypothetical protein